MHSQQERQLDVSAASVKRLLKDARFQNRMAKSRELRYNESYQKSLEDGRQWEPKSLYEVPQHSHYWQGYIRALEIVLEMENE
jgi:hypothetical protein